MRNSKNRNSRSPYVSTCMVVQQLERKDFDWTSSVRSGFYDDKTIMKTFKKYNNGSGPTSPKAKDHYLYLIFQHQYIPLMNNYPNHEFNDYDFIFNDKHLSLADKANIIIRHVAIRLEYFSFMDYYRNRNHSKSKKRKVFSGMKLAGILHNADVSVYGDIVKPHFHMAIKLGKRATFNQLAKWSGIPAQYFDSSNKGRYAFQNEVAYLTHIKQPQKHLYNPKNVWSNAWSKSSSGRLLGYLDYYKAHRTKWLEYRATASSKQTSISKNLILQMVRNGKLTYQQLLLNKPIFDVYTSSASMMNEVNNLYQARANRVAAMTRIELEQRKFGLSVIFICGPSNSGKTTLADHITEDLHKKHGWKTYHTIPHKKGGASHVFDDYQGEPVIYWDEARSGDMGPSEWLQLLDPRHENSIDARYNAKKLAARVIIITTLKAPDEFFGFMKGVHQDEPLTQFMRRIGITIHVRVVDGKHFYWYNPIIDRGRNVSVKIGRDRNGNQVYKKTRFVEGWPDDDPLGMHEATSKALNYIDENNDPKRIHKPGKRPLLTSKRLPLHDYTKGQPIRLHRHWWRFYNESVLTIANSKEDNHLKRKYKNFDRFKFNQQLKNGAIATYQYFNPLDPVQGFTSDNDDRIASFENQYKKKHHGKSSKP